MIVRLLPVVLIWTVFFLLPLSAAAQDCQFGGQDFQVPLEAPCDSLMELYVLSSYDAVVWFEEQNPNPISDTFFVWITLDACERVITASADFFDGTISCTDTYEFTIQATVDTLEKDIYLCPDSPNNSLVDEFVTTTTSSCGCDSTVQFLRFYAPCLDSCSVTEYFYPVELWLDDSDGCGSGADLTIEYNYQGTNQVYQKTNVSGSWYDTLGPFMEPIDITNWLFTPPTANEPCGASGADISAFAVHYPILPMVDLGADLSFCAGESQELIPQTDVQNPSFTWSGGQTSDQLSVSTSGVYSVTVQDAEGCTGTDAVSVNVIPLPTIDPSPNTHLCPGDSLLLSVAHNGATILWKDGQTANSILINEPNNYCFLVTGSEGCTISDSIEIVGVPEPVIFPWFSPDPVCWKEPVELFTEGAPDYDYIWTSPEGELHYSPSVFIQEVAEADRNGWSVSAENSFGCRVEQGIELNLIQPPVIVLPDDIKQCEGEELVIVPKILFTLQDELEFSWEAPDWYSSDSIAYRPGEEMTKATSGTYLFTVTDSHGCTENKEIDVKIKYCCDSKTAPLYIPNAFSPNGDGLNEVIVPLSGGEVEIDHFRIFDRWGTMVHHTEFFQPGDETAAWDGTFGGKVLPPGVYVYKVVGRCQTTSLKRDFVLTGDITLIR